LLRGSSPADAFCTRPIIRASGSWVEKQPGAASGFHNVKELAPPRAGHSLGEFCSLHVGIVGRAKDWPVELQIAVGIALDLATGEACAF
jgi:hypothetical protein